MKKYKLTIVLGMLTCLTHLLSVSPGLSRPVEAHSSPTPSIWARTNVHAWEIANYDLKRRNAEQRAQMLEKLGIRHYVYLSRADPYGQQADVNTTQLDVDAEIEAMQRHGIDIRAWYFWINTDNPAQDTTLTKTLEAFRRHRIHPQIWVPQSFDRPNVNSQDNFPKTPEQQQDRVTSEAKRIAAVVKRAAPYGCTVDIYNHRGWFGMIPNELAILERLKELGVTNVGMVYNFMHSSSDLHDDGKSFASLWPKMMPHVVAINVFVTGSPRELGMMKIIQDSGWHGPVGVVALFGDAELALQNALWSLDWARAEINSPEPLARTTSREIVGAKHGT